MLKCGSVKQDWPWEQLSVCSQNGHGLDWGPVLQDKWHIGGGLSISRKNKKGNYSDNNDSTSESLPEQSSVILAGSSGGHSNASELESWS